MKVKIELDMTPDEARSLMGLPDVTRLNEKILAEMQKHVADPEALMKAWMPPGMEQFQRFLWEGAKRTAGKGPKNER
jgi:hypothetical protein